MTTINGVISPTIIRNPASLGDELIVDGGMEGPNPGANWTGLGANPTTEFATVHSGTQSLRLSRTSGALNGAYQTITTVPGRSYKFVGYGYNPGGSLADTLEFKAGTTPGGQQLDSASSSIENSWIEFDREFVATTTTTYIFIGLTDSITLEWVFWDDVSLKPILY